MDLNDILKKVLLDFEVLIETKSATINLSALPVIRAEPLQMNQLFYHLISNALKFNKGKPVIDISDRQITEDDHIRYPELRKGGSFVCISVKDNGIGFNQKYASKLFILFQQLKDIHETGTGIGLAICKKMIENHHEHIAAGGK